MRVKHFACCFCVAKHLTSLGALIFAGSCLQLKKLKLQKGAVFLKFYLKWKSQCGAPWSGPKKCLNAQNVMSHTGIAPKHLRESFSPLWGNENAYKTSETDWHIFLMAPSHPQSKQATYWLILSYFQCLSSSHIQTTQGKSVTTHEVVNYSVIGRV